MAVFLNPLLPLFSATSILCKRIQIREILGDVGDDSDKRSSELETCDSVQSSERTDDGWRSPGVGRVGAVRASRHASANAPQSDPVDVDGYRDDDLRPTEAVDTASVACWRRPSVRRHLVMMWMMRVVVVGVH